MARALTWWLVLAGLWLALIDNHHLDELAAGLVVTLVATAVAIVALDRMSPGVRVPLRAVAVLPRVAWRMTADSGLLLRALWQTVVLRRPVRGRWVSEPIDDADTPAARGHRVFTVLAGTAAPNRVVGDTEGGRLVVHELVSTDEPLDPLAQR
jgi:Na+/H+ ion antiporter subunit